MPPFNYFPFYRDGIALKKTEAKENEENKKGQVNQIGNLLVEKWDLILTWLFQGLSDVATILARRVAVEFSDSDDGPSDSEYDSDDWGEINYLLKESTLKLLILNIRRDGCLTARASARPAEQQHTASNQLQVTPWPDNTLAITNDPQYY